MIGALGIGGGMGFFGGGTRYVGPKPVNYLFIDGGYLRRVYDNFIMKIFGRNGTIFPDFELIKNYGNPKSTKVFYYDCPVPRKKSESKEDHDNRLKIQEGFFNSIRYLDGYHLFVGQTVGHPRITSYNVCYTKLLRINISTAILTSTCFCRSSPGWPTV